MWAGAVVSVVDLFELTAIGGYTELGEDSSLFRLCLVSCPHWVALHGSSLPASRAGFGYNRSLPPPGLLDEHPFMQVMRGDLVLKWRFPAKTSFALSASFYCCPRGNIGSRRVFNFTSFWVLFKEGFVVTVGFGPQIFH